MLIGFAIDKNISCIDLKFHHNLVIEEVKMKRISRWGIGPKFILISIIFALLVITIGQRYHSIFQNKLKNPQVSLEDL